MSRKTCSKCGIEKNTSEFYPDNRIKCGLKAACKECRKIADRSRYTDGGNQINASQVEYYRLKRESILAYAKEYRLKNADLIKTKAKEYRAKNPDRNRLYCASHKKEVCANVQNREAKKRANGGVLSKGLAQKLFKLQRGKCACGCKQSIGDNYHLDHIMPIALGGFNTDENIQLLRATCNQEKHAKHPIDFMQSKGFLL